jgi:hypothetical protein
LETKLQVLLTLLQHMPRLEWDDQLEHLTPWSSFQQQFWSAGICGKEVQSEGVRPEVECVLGKHGINSAGFIGGIRYQLSGRVIGVASKAAAATFTSSD